jgi:hypothetical protein
MMDDIKLEAAKGAKITLFSLIGLGGSVTIQERAMLSTTVFIQEWGPFLGLLVGAVTLLYTLTNWLFLLRTWYVKEKAHKKRPPSGFIPLDTTE